MGNEMTAPISRMRVLAIPGSLRRESCNRRLLAQAAVLAAPRMQIDLYEDLRDVPMFDEDLEASTDGGPGPVRHLRAAVAAADGLLIATPEYNHSLPGVLKNAIDWLSRATPLEVLAGKPVAVIGASSGRWGTRLAQAALRQVLAATEAVVMPAPMLFLRDAAQAFDAEGRLGDDSALLEVLAAFDGWMARVGAHRHR
jgi:chromate reductase, NAD(P)H dehydrogenase (quinone)